MLKHSRSMTLFGGILAFFSFALPWDNQLSGAELANSGQGTIITIIIVAAVGIVGISIFMLNRYTTWHPMSKIVSVIISSIVLFLYIVISDVLIGSRYETNNGRISAIAIIFILAVGLFCISIYFSNRHVYSTFWRIGLALILAGIGILTCSFLIILNIKNGINLMIINFIAAVTIIAFSIYMLIAQPPWKSLSTLLVLLCSTIGLCCFFAIFLADSLDLKFEGDFLFKPRYGAFLTAIGYIFTIIGVLGNLKTDSSNTQVTEARSGEEE